MLNSKYDFLCLFSKDFFEIFNFSVPQNLTIFEATRHFGSKSQKIIPDIIGEGKKIKSLSDFLSGHNFFNLTYAQHFIEF